MLTLRKASDRGLANHGWLKSFHTFSFASYRDPREQGFSDLLVINDDRVAAGKGFGQHPHRDMEIFSYVLEGALEHKDTLGTGSVIRPGDVQLMSAGSGVAHSEYNHSATRPVHFLQIWIVPDISGAKPRYQQEHFSTQKKRGRLQLIISPDGSDGSLTVRQDARVYAGLFDGKESATLKLSANRYAYVHVARGSVELNGQLLTGSQVLCIDNEDSILTGMHSLLSRWGCQVWTARNRLECEHLLDENVRPQLALVDYHLDDGDTGTELMAWLRTRLGEPLPGVVISADGRPELIAQVHAAGLDYLPKPVKPAALRALLSRHLALR